MNVKRWQVSSRSVTAMYCTVPCQCVVYGVRQMSTGQKYRRTEFEDNDDNNSAGEANSPGVVYNPVIAFHSASFSSGRGGLIGRGCCARRSGLEKLLLAVVAALSVVIIVLMVMLGASGHADSTSSTQAMTSRLQAKSPAMTGGQSVIDDGMWTHTMLSWSLSSNQQHSCNWAKWNCKTTRQSSHYSDRRSYVIYHTVVCYTSWNLRLRASIVGCSSLFDISTYLYTLLMFGCFLCFSFFSFISSFIFCTCCK